MHTRLIRIATLSAALLLAPATRLSLAADEPKDPKAGQTPPRPGAGGPEGRRLEPSAMLDRIESALNDLKLSEEQKTKAKDLLDKVHKTVDNNKEGGREGIAKAMGELREGLNGLLTEDQKKQLGEKLPFLNRNGPRDGAPGAGRPGAAGQGQRPAAMQKAMEAALEKLSLSDEQKSKIKSLNEELEKKTRTIIEEGKGDRAAIGEKIRPLMDERRQKMSEILSSEQMTKYQEAMREQMEKMRGEGGGPGARRPGGDRPAAPKPEGDKPQEKKAEEK